MFSQRREQLAVWEYCEASAAHIFGNALGDPIADEILAALQQAGAAGMSRTAIRDLFGRHKSGDRLRTALALLAVRGRARMEPKMTLGRATEMWFAGGSRAWSSKYSSAISPTITTHRMLGTSYSRIIHSVLARVA
jgi:hypothetical protein